MQLQSAASPRKRRGGAATQTRGDRNIRWIEEHCCIPEGDDVGKPVRLRDWQRAEVRRIYDNPHGTRMAILSFGRKNAKTALSAFLLLLHLCGPEARVNSQLVSSATSKEQAAVLFSLAARVVRMSPTLSSYVVIRDTFKQLACSELGTIYRALSAEASTAHGLSPVFIVHDELGRVKGPRSELYEALETATGAHSNPLSVVISTQAPTDDDLLSRLIDDAMSGRDPRNVVSLYTAPKDEDPFTEEAIRKANPAFGDFLIAENVLKAAADAKALPSREAEYRNLHLNQRVESEAPLFSESVWKQNGAKPKSIKGVPVYGGLDLSAVNDLTALVLIGKVENVWQVESTFWLPEDGLAERSRADRIEYDVWHKAGYLRLSPGKSVDYDYVAEYLRNVFDNYDIQKIAFDAWNFKHLRPCLLRAGFTEEQLEVHFEEFRQGFQTMSPALRDLESEVLNSRLAHGMHPILNFCAGNARVKADEAGNRKLDKKHSHGRIDGMVALTMAMGVAPLNAEDAPISIFERPDSALAKQLGAAPVHVSADYDEDEVF